MSKHLSNFPIVVPTVEYKKHMKKYLKGKNIEFYFNGKKKGEINMKGIRVIIYDADTIAYKEGT